MICAGYLFIFWVYQSALCRADNSIGTPEIFCSLQNIHQEAFLCQKLNLVGGERAVEW